MFLIKIVIEKGNFISTWNIVQIVKPCSIPPFKNKMERKTIRLVSRHIFICRIKHMDSQLWQCPDPSGVRYEYTDT